MRARLPDESGYVVNNGVRVYYETFGSGPVTLLLMPTWSIVDARHWKMQVPFLARHYRVITFDGRGNGKSDRPKTARAYSDDAFVGDALAVLDAVGAERAVLAGYCVGFLWSVLVAHRHPDRVAGIVAIAPNPPLTPPHPERGEYSFDESLATDAGWAKENRHYWLRDWPGYVDFFTSQIASEPHSTKVHDDLRGYGLQTDAETMLCETAATRFPYDAEASARLCRELTCPVLVVCGDGDRIVPAERGRLVAELTGGSLVEIEGAGHAPHARYPVVVNHAIREFVDNIAGRPKRVAWASTTLPRRRRALWISSPIGLGHVRRDIAIAREVRRRVPDLEIHWWAQPPVTEVLAEAGEIIHPVSAEMASESAHWESTAAQHDLHAFYALRHMDEIFCANYMLFDDVVRDTRYDLWAGDECWEVDYYLHENPERKIAPYAFMTDVIGFLPTDAEADPREAELCTDYNADAIEKRERYPSLRDVSMFIGSWDELPDASFGAGLPRIREWSQRWFSSVPYVLPFDPDAFGDRARLRAELDLDPDAPLIVAAVGGTAVGTDLLGLIADAFGRLRKEQSDVRMLMITGPRIDPRSLPDIEGMEKRGYVSDLVRYLAGCDAAVVQGGLSTTMELVGLGRPFVYFPLARHFEQQHFVTHRLRHHRAGIPMDYATTTSEDLAAALRSTLGQDRAAYRRIPPDGAARAADQIAPLLTRSR
ncbi:MAG TPA: alpha/beta fold hydrolase [Jatrophihabitans sp.]|nr:alpha/beta fold hydrolase [Jatrophihabitans sp.]